MEYYAVIDTNVLVSAMLKRTSIPGTIIELVFSGMIIPVFNSDILTEYRTVLSRAKFHFNEDVVDTIVSEIERIGVRVESEEIDLEMPDPKDKVFFEVTLTERKTLDAYLVTGNIKHFPSQVFVVTPRQMLDIILDSMQ